MTLKDPKTIILGLYHKNVKIEGNLYRTEKLFLINSIINHLFKGGAAKLDKTMLSRYAELIDRYLKNEIDIYWEDGRLLVEELSGTGG
jgi:hypothetical protein